MKLKIILIKRTNGRDTSRDKFDFVHHFLYVNFFFVFFFMYNKVYKQRQKLSAELLGTPNIISMKYKSRCFIFQVSNFFKTKTRRLTLACFTRVPDEIWFQRKSWAGKWNSLAKSDNRQLDVGRLNNASFLLPICLLLLNVEKILQDRSEAIRSAVSVK